LVQSEYQGNAHLKDENEAHQNQGVDQGCLEFFIGEHRDVITEADEFRILVQNTFEIRLFITPSLLINHARLIKRKKVFW
jgi:hypothetical protein